MRPLIRGNSLVPRPGGEPLGRRRWRHVRAVGARLGRIRELLSYPFIRWADAGFERFMQGLREEEAAAQVERRCQQHRQADSGAYLYEGGLNTAPAPVCLDDDSLFAR